MTKTITEKIFSRKCGCDVSAGEMMVVPVDAAMVHDITGPLAVNMFHRMKGEKVFDPEKIIMIFDHQVPADSITAAENHIMMREFAREQGIYNYDVKEGICHQVALETGKIMPGDIVVGVDSHTCTYGAVGAFSTGIGSTDMGFVLRFGALYFRIPESVRIEADGKFAPRVGAKDLIMKTIGDIGADGATYRAAEFTGQAFEEMEIPGRMTCCNMAIEMGGKAGIVPPDEKTRKWLSQWGDVSAAKPGSFDLKADEGAAYAGKVEYDVGDLVPQVAVPHNVDNVVDIDEVEGTHLDQVFIGSCTNGRYEDFAEAAEVMGDKKFSPDVRVIAIPASRTEYLKCLRAGIIEKFVEAGALFEAPCCGPCMGGAFGLIGVEEVSLSTSNRNFRGRQGSTKGEVYLCSPATAAASAIKGEITDPREV